MRAVLPLALLLALPLAAACDPAGKEPAVSDDRFGGELAVRVLSPANGETVPSTFTLQYRVGSAVASIALTADGAPVESLSAVEPGVGEWVVTLPEGRHDLELRGFDAAGDETSRDALAVRIADEGVPWVTLTSPADGAEVPNPVTFAVTAAEGIDTVEVFADDWPIGTVDTSGDGEATLTYSFTGTGYARAIEARSADGAASDTISIVVSPAEDTEASSFNDVVLRYLETYPTDGTHEYYWPSDGDWYGVTRDLWYLDTLLAEADPYGRCYCVGLTWEVYLRAFDEIDRTTGGDGSLNGMSLADMDDFRVDWFVHDLDGPGPSFAMENYGVGALITDVSQLRPGDFVQFWRHSGSGHSVIFVDWLNEGDEIVGIEYWSTQSSTDGVGYNSEYFGSSGSRIDPNLVFGARGRMPEDWEGWR